MSWSAHAVDTVIGEVAPRVPRLRLRGDGGSAIRPELEQLIPPHRIIALAKKHKLVKSVKLIGRRRYAVIVAGAIALGAVGSPLGASTTSHGFSAASLTLPFVIISVVIAALAVCAQLLIESLRRESESSPTARAAEEIAEQARQERPSDAFKDFIYDLAAELSRPSKFRCLLVDDFTKLDLITRMVLQVYLEYHVHAEYPELWVLFYSADDKWLRVKAAVNGRDKPYGFRRIKIYVLDHLSAVKRQELADERGLAERGGYHTIGTIIRGDGATVMKDLFRQEYDERSQLVDGVRVGDIMAFFYVLALNAMPGHNRWMTTAEIRTNFSRQRKNRSRILALLLRGRNFSATQIDQYLRLMAGRYFPQAGSKSGENLGGTRFRKFVIAPEAGEDLESSGQEFDLPDPSIVHLFWVLYWSDKELHGATDIGVLPMICAHLLKSTTPGEVRDLLGAGQADLDAFTDDLFNTVLDLVRTCLKLCQLQDVPKLLEYALRLTDDDRQQIERRRRTRLRPLVWQAYGLLGEEDLLAIIVDLEQTSVRRPAAATPKQDLSYFFVQSIARADRETRDLVHAELTRAGSARHAGAYARARAGWLVASVAPFLRPGMSSLKAVAHDAGERMPGVVATSVGTLESVPDGEWRTTDFLDVLTGLWALTLISDEDRAPAARWDLTTARATTGVETLTHTYLLATDLAKQRQSADPSPAALDLVLDCLVEELLTVVLAAGILMLRRWPDSIWTDQASREDVVEVVRESARVLGMSEDVLTRPGGTPDRPLIDELTRYMTLLTVLWRRLGFHQQASFMAVRQAQFLAVVLDHDAHLAESAMELLATEMKRPDHIGLLAHLATAEAASASQQLEAEWLTRCSQAAVKGRFADRMAAELCLGAIEAGHAFGIDFSECLDFLLDRWAGESSRRLETLLPDITDAEMANFTRAILNIASHDTSDRADRVSEYLERRIADVTDPDVKKSVTGLFRIFVLRRHLDARQAVDVNVELDDWDELKTQPEYAFLLYLLFPVSPRDTHDRLINESVAVLENSEVYLTTTGYVFLAMRLLVNTGTSSNAGTVALRALERGFDYSERGLTADFNISILNILKRIDTQHRTKYQPKFFEWQKIMLELDQTRRLPQLVDQGRFFLLIWHYFQLFADYQLPSDPPMDQYGLDDQEMAQALAEWVSNGRAIPDPVIGEDARARLSGEFLRWGYALFFAEPAKTGGRPVSEAEIEDGRQQFDHKAMTSINRVYHMLRSLPAIPRSVEQILRRHEALVRSLLISSDREPADE